MIQPSVLLCVPGVALGYRIMPRVRGAIGASEARNVSISPANVRGVMFLATGEARGMLRDRGQSRPFVYIPGLHPGLLSCAPQVRGLSVIPCLAARTTHSSENDILRWWLA